MPIPNETARRPRVRTTLDRALSVFDVLYLPTRTTPWLIRISDSVNEDDIEGFASTLVLAAPREAKHFTSAVTTTDVPSSPVPL